MKHQGNDALQTIEDIYYDIYMICVQQNGFETNVVSHCPVSSVILIH